MFMLGVQRDMEQWRLGLNIRLYSSAYAVSGMKLLICHECSSIKDIRHLKNLACYLFHSGLDSIRIGVPTTVMVPAKERAPLCRCVQPVDAHLRRGSELPSSQRGLVPREVNTFLPMHMNGCASADSFSLSLNSYVLLHLQCAWFYPNCGWPILGDLGKSERTG